MKKGDPWEWFPTLLWMGMIAVWAVFWITVWGTAIYVGIHFLRKVW